MNEDLVKRARKMCDQRPGILRDALEDVALRMADRTLSDAEVIKVAEALAEAVTREREMPCQDMDMQLGEIQAVDEALAAFHRAKQHPNTLMEDKNDE